MKKTIAHMRKLPPSLGRRYTTLGARSLPRTLLLGAALILIVAAVAITTLTFAQPAAAQTELELVGNDGQTSTDAHAGTLNRNHATSFTTGGSLDGYVLTRVDVNLKQNSGSGIISFNFILNVHTDDSGVPGTLIAQGKQENTFSKLELSIYDDPLRTEPAGINLDPNTKYWVTVLGSSSEGDLSKVLVAGTSSDDEDSTGSPGWSIGNNRLWQPKGAGSSWSNSNTNALQMNLVGYALDTTAPAFQSARVSNDGTTLTLFYNEELDPTSVPNVASIAVKVNGGTNQNPSSVTVAGSTMTLVLPSAAQPSASHTVAVTYDGAGATSPLRDLARNNATTLNRVPVRNDRSATIPTVSSSAFGSTQTHDTDSPADGTKDTYGGGAKIAVSLTFSEAVTVDTSRARPRLQIELHADFTPKWAVYESGSDSTQLTFAYTVENGDSSSNGTTDVGIRVIPNSLKLTGGTIRSTSSGRDANLAHAQLGTSLVHKVNGSLDGQGPRFELATLTDTSLVIKFDEDLDSTSAPAGSSICVTATSTGGTSRRICGSTAAFDTLLPVNLNVTLETAVRHDETVTITYTKPASNPLQDANGNAVASFSSQPVTNSTIAVAVVTLDSVVQGSRSDSLDISWSKAATGVAPTGYDLRYYAGTENPPAGREADWIDDTAGLPEPAAADTTATIKGLTANTAYQVQLRAKTSSQTGPWTASVSATTAEAPATNNAPRVLRPNPADAQGNVCRVDTNPLGTPGRGGSTRIVVGVNTLGSYVPLTGRRGETTTWPSICSGTNADAPLFDDIDADDLIITAEPYDLPDNVRLDHTNAFHVTQQTTTSQARLFFKGSAAFRQTMAWAKLTATDEHGASVSTNYVGFRVTVIGNTGPPNIADTDDQNAYTSREFSLVLPRPTGGDLGGGIGQSFPYFYRLTGLPKGLAFDRATRTISGTPLETGTFTVTYTVDDADDQGSSYLNPSNTDETTNVADIASDSFTITVASTPHIDIVRVVSAPTHDANGDGKNDTYGDEDKIVIDVEYSEPVQVNGTVGTANGVRLRLDLGQNDDNLTNSRTAAELTGVHHGGKTLRFEYEVDEEDHDPDGVWVQTHPTSGQILFIRGTATITDLATGAVTADVNKPGATTGHALDQDGIPLTYVNGRLSAAGPKPTSATVNGATLSVTFNENLAALDSDDLKELTLNFGVQGVDYTGGNRNAWQHPTQVGTTANANELGLTLGIAARAGDVVTLSYQRIGHKGPIKDADGNMAPGFVDFEVTNNTAGSAGPQPLHATVQGTTLEIVFNVSLDSSSTVQGNSFTVRASDPDYDHRTIAGTGTATISGTKVTVTLADALLQDERAQVSLKASSGLQSNTSVAAQSFNGFKIETVKDVAAPELVGGAAVQTRDIPVSTQVALYFSETMHPNYVPENDAFSITVGTAAAVNPSAVAIEANAVMLTIAKAAAADATVTVSYTLPDSNNKRLKDLAGNDAAAITSEALTATAAGTPKPTISDLPGDATTLVSNTGQSGTTNSNLTFDYAQAFSTGNNAVGYKLTSVMVPYLSQTPTSSSHAVSVHTSNSGHPATSLGTLSYGTVSGTSVTYTAPSTGIDLDPGTEYVVVLDSSADLSGVSVDRTSSDSEDTGAAKGWSLKNTSLIRQRANINFTSSVTSWQIAIHGYAKSLDLKADGARMALTYDKPLDPTSLPDPERFQLHDEDDIPAHGIAAVAVEHEDLVLTLNGPVSPCDAPFTMSYRRSATGDNIRSLTGHDADDIETMQVTNVRKELCINGRVVVQTDEPSGNSGGEPDNRGKSLRLSFHRPLNTGKTLKASTFSLAAASGAAAPAIKAAAYTDDGVALTLARALKKGEKVTLSYTRPQGQSGLWDADGNQLADFSEVAVPVRSSGPPTVTRVEVISDAGEDQTYALGDTIRVSVTFDEAVDVDTTDGAPRLKIDMDPAAHWGDKWTNYDGGSGTASLTFSHEVVEPNESTQGIAVLPNTLDANGAAIRSVSGTADAQLAHDGLDHDPDHKVDWRLTPPGTETISVTEVTVVSDAGDDDTYRRDDVIQIRVTFEETVEVEGTPRVTIDMDPAPHWGEKWATYAGGAGTNSLTFSHKVVKPNESTQGIAVLANSLQANGGSITPANAEARVNLAHAGLNHDPAHKVDWRSVTDIEIVSDSGDDATYRLGDVIEVTVTFDEAVQVEGTPRLKIDMDPASHWGEKWATYDGGSGTYGLTFVYEVVEPNESTQGIAVLANSLEANDGTIRSASTDATLDLAHTGLNHDPNHKVDWR